MYSDLDWILSNLYWEQVFSGQQAGIAVGRVDPTDFIDILGYGNPWTGFQNASIILNATIVLPDPGIGVAFAARVLEQWTVVAGLYDANGKMAEIDAFDGGAEFFKHLELGWSPSAEDRFFKRVHLIGWHVDERDDAGIPASWGLGLSASWVFSDRWTTFLRAGWSDGNAPPLNAGVTAGVIRTFKHRNDAVGIGASWGSPAVSELRDQYSFETYYRFQFAQNLAITPSVQLLVNPALNPDNDTIWILGVQLRLTL
jgi:porin